VDELAEKVALELVGPLDLLFGWRLENTPSQAEFLD
jgi:hypothetical protein